MVNTTHPVTIIIPVYGDWESLGECIESLKEHIDTRVHKVILANDCGPDADSIEEKIVNSIDKYEGFVYHRNEKNLGFVGNCNNAVQNLDESDNDILLLNSDTKVTAGFLEEMLAVLYEADSRGVVSPRSNNATLATVPLSSAHIKGVGAEASYALFEKMKYKLPRTVVVPVAHGFCMLIRRHLINQYGLFDPVFGKGYGEEVDFCMRIKQHGFQCVLANRAYVFHLEARSFSLETKAKLLEANNKIIWSRYPNYRQSVRDYMTDALAREGVIEREVTTRKNSTELGIRYIVRKNRLAYGLARKIAALINR